MPSAISSAGLWRFLILALVLLVALTSAPQPPSAQNTDQLFVAGQVQWSNGGPAHGVEVRLMRDHSVVETTFTNLSGHFAFFNIPGLPRDYRVLIATSARVEADMPIGDVPIGISMPPIMLH